MFWVENAGAWHGPVPIGLNQDAPAGAPLAASRQFNSSDQTDLFFINNAGMLVAAWVESAGKWKGPIRLM